MFILSLHNFKCSDSLNVSRPNTLGLDQFHFVCSFNFRTISWRATLLLGWSSCLQPFVGIAFNVFYCVSAPFIYVSCNHFPVSSVVKSIIFFPHNLKQFFLLTSDRLQFLWPEIGGTSSFHRTSIPRHFTLFRMHF